MKYIFTIILLSLFWSPVYSSEDILYYSPKVQNIEETKTPCQILKGTFDEVIDKMTNKYGDDVKITHNENVLIGKYIIVTLEKENEDPLEIIFTTTKDGCTLARGLQVFSMAMNNKEQEKKQDANLEAEQFALFTNFRAESELDFVSKVLNYSNFGNDEGIQHEFWYPLDKENCIYAKAKFWPIVGWQTNYVKFAGFKPQTETIDLNKVDPRSIKVQEFTNRSNGNKSWNLNINNGKVIMNCGNSQPNCDPDRINRGWSQVYEEYCSGIMREF